MKNFYLNINWGYTAKYPNLLECINYKDLGKNNWYNNLGECRKAISGYVEKFKEYLLENGDKFNYNPQKDTYTLPTGFDEDTEFTGEYQLKDIDRYFELHVQIFSLIDNYIYLENGNWMSEKSNLKQLLDNEKQRDELPF